MGARIDELEKSIADLMEQVRLHFRLASSWRVPPSRLTDKLHVCNRRTKTAATRTRTRRGPRVSLQRTRASPSERVIHHQKIKRRKGRGEEALAASFKISEVVVTKVLASVRGHRLHHFPTTHITQVQTKTSGLFFPYRLNEIKTRSPLARAHLRRVAGKPSARLGRYGVDDARRLSPSCP